MLETDAIKSILSLYIQTLSVFVAIMGGLLTSRLISMLISKNEVIHNLNLENSKKAYLQNKRTYFLDIMKEHFMGDFLYANLADIVEKEIDGTFTIENCELVVNKHLPNEFVIEKLNFIKDNIRKSIDYYKNGDILYRENIQAFLKSIEIKINSNEYKIMEHTLRKLCVDQPKKFFNNSLEFGKFDFGNTPPIYEQKEIAASQKEVERIEIELEYVEELINTYKINLYSFDGDVSLNSLYSFFAFITVFGIILPLIILTLLTFMDLSKEITMGLIMLSFLTFFVSIFFIILLPGSIYKLILKVDGYIK